MALLLRVEEFMSGCSLVVWLCQHLLLGITQLKTVQPNLKDLSVNEILPQNFKIILCTLVQC